jgi:hypothetical protein
MKKNIPIVRLVREEKIARLLSPPRGGNVWEASGVFAKGRQFFVVFDNTRRAACLGADLEPGSGSHRWLGRARSGEGYEAITYSPHRRRFYLVIEAEKHPDGTYKGVIEECDEQWRYRGRHWVNFEFDKRNTGFEGLAAVRWRGDDYLLALCEGNRCRAGRKGHRRGKGRIHVLQLKNGMWEPIARIKLPRQAKFKDYADLAIHGDRLAVVSQESSGLWIGRLRLGRWTPAGVGRRYKFPRSKKGKQIYCTVEGISWLSRNTFVAVSDLKKHKHPKRCGRTDQSVHLFRV